MADEAVIKSFLVQLGYKIDESSSDKFIGAIAAATRRVFELGAAVEAAGLAVVGFVASVASNLEKLYYESERTKTSIENLRAFAFAMSNIGVSADEAYGAAAKLGEFMRTSPGAKDWLQQTFNEFAHGAKVTDDVTENLKNLGVAFSNMSDMQAQAMGRARGLSYNMIEALRNHGKEIQGFENLVHDAYNRIGFDAQDAGVKSRAFMNELRAVWSAGLEPLIDKIAVELMPGLTAEMERFRQLILNNSQQIEDVAKTVINYILWIGDELLHVGGNVAKFISDLINDFNSLDAPTKHLVELIGGIGAALVLLNRNPFLLIIGGLLALISDYEDWKRGSAHFIDWGTWAPEIKKALDDFKEFADWLDKLVTSTVGWQHALEFLAGFMATKWLVGMMAGLGPVGVAIAAIVAALAIAKSAMGDFDLSKLPIGSPLWQGVSENEQLKYPNSPASQAAYGGGNNPNQFSWWNPGSWLGHGPPGPNTAEQQRTSNWLMDYFTSKGETKEQAAGIVGNFRAESSFNPYASNQGHLGFGQWDAQRQADFARIYGHAVNDTSVDRNQLILEQAQFTLHELQTTHKAAGDVLSKQSSAGGSADVVGGGFEIYGNDPAEAAKRRAYAEAALAQYDAIKQQHDKMIAAANTNIPLDKYSKPQSAPVLAAPGAQTNNSKAGANVNNTQHITNNIHTSSDPNSIVSALNRVNVRANADIIRQTRSALV